MSFHTGQTFTFGEQPSATKWQYLWDNDYALADGSGIEDDAILARHIADDVVSAFSHLTASGASVKKSATQSLATATIAAVTFDQEEFDTDSYHSTASNTSRLTVPKAGKYLICANLTFAPQTAGTRFAWFGINGDGTNYRLALSGGMDPELDDCGLSCFAIEDLAANDYVELFAYQSSGGNLNINAEAGKTGYTRFSIARLGA